MTCKKGMSGLVSVLTLRLFQADPREWEARMPNGLVKGHAYSITGMRMVGKS